MCVAAWHFDFEYLCLVLVSYIVGAIIYYINANSEYIRIRYIRT